MPEENFENGLAVDWLSLLFVVAAGAALPQADCFCPMPPRLPNPLVDDVLPPKAVEDPKVGAFDAGAAEVLVFAPQGDALFPSPPKLAWPNAVGWLDPVLAPNADEPKAGAFVAGTAVAVLDAPQGDDLAPNPPPVPKAGVFDWPELILPNGEAPNAAAAGFAKALPKGEAVVEPIEAPNPDGCTGVDVFAAVCADVMANGLFSRRAVL